MGRAHEWPLAGPGSALQCKEPPPGKGAEAEKESHYGHIFTQLADQYALGEYATGLDEDRAGRGPHDRALPAR